MDLGDFGIIRAPSSGVVAFVRHSILNESLSQSPLR